MLRRVLLLGALVLAFGAAEAQAGTVFKACLKDPLSTFIGECGNVYMADPGQDNDVVFRPQYVNGAFYETFSESGQVIRPPIGPTHRDEYFDRQGAVGQPVVHETLLGCVFAGLSATCDWEYDNCCGTPYDRALVFLGDGDDTLLTQGDVEVVPTVYAEEGDDTIRSRFGGRIDCGPGTDTVYTGWPGGAAANCENVIGV